MNGDAGINLACSRLEEAREVDGPEVNPAADGAKAPMELSMRLQPPAKLGAALLPALLSRRPSTRLSRTSRRKLARAAPKAEVLAAPPACEGRKAGLGGRLNESEWSSEKELNRLSRERRRARALCGASSPLASSSSIAPCSRMKLAFIGWPREKSGEYLRAWEGVGGRGRA